MAAKYHSIDDFSHDPKLAEALGNMVVAWAHAENMVFSTFARVANIGLNMAIMSYNRIPTFESRVKFVSALLNEWQTDKYDKDEITKALEKLAKLASTRNHWMHGDWYMDTDRTETVIFNNRVPPGSKDKRKSVKAADVINHCEAVKKRANALGALLDADQLVP